MSTGSLPATNIYSTWMENVEVWSADDNTLYDLSGVTEIVLKLQDPYTLFDELTVSMTGGGITIPAPGIIQWRVEIGHMGTLPGKTYRALLTLSDGGTTLALILGTVSVIE